MSSKAANVPDKVAINSSVAIALAIALLVSLAFAQNFLRSITSGATALIPLPAEYAGLSIDPRIVKRLLGTRLVWADLIWIDTLIKADTTHSEKDFSDFYQAFKAIITLDPDNLYAYWVGGLYLSVIKDDIKGATAILREGVQHMERHPDSVNGFKEAWRLPFTLGYNLIFEEQEFEAGAPWIRKSAEMPGAPIYVKDLAKRFSSEIGILEVGSRVLGDLYKRVGSEEEKAKIEKKMVNIAAMQELLELNNKFKGYLSSTGAYALPKQRAFTLFMRSLGHSGRDLKGRRLEIDALGVIVAK